MPWGRDTMHLSAKSSDPQPAAAVAHIVIVEDDLVIAGLMQDAMEAEGFRVSIVGGGAELRSLLATDTISLITLDLGLPAEDGIDLAREICSRFDIPLIIVSGKSKTVTKVVGLEVGADDYIVKPFELEELIARVRAILRRARRGSGGAAPVAISGDATAYSFEGWLHDIKGYRLRAPDGRTVDLTSSELDLLTVFVRNARTTLTREMIALALKGVEDKDPAAERSIDVLVGRLRRKLEKYRGGSDLIRTVRGEGYLFSCAATPAQSIEEK